MNLFFRRFLSAVLIVGMGLLSSGVVRAANLPRVYEDVPKTAWFRESVDYVSALGIMKGVGADKFAPRQELSRAMFITMLYRLAGSPEVSTEGQQFSDVPQNAYYARATAWGLQKGIVFGVRSDEFRPGVHITRQEMACMISRYARLIQAPFLSEEYHVEQSFTDRDDSSAYAVADMELMVYRGLFRGYGDGCFRPRSTATRGEAATVMMRLALLLERVPAPGVLNVGTQRMELSSADTVSLYCLLHNGAWTPAEYAEYEPVFTLQLWGTEYRFAEASAAYNGFNLVASDGSYSGMQSKNSDSADLDLIFSIFELNRKITLRNLLLEVPQTRKEAYP